MRVGLYGQVRRVWAPRGVKVTQSVQIERKWAYLALAVDVHTGRFSWCWLDNMKGESIAQTIRQWQAEGIAGVVWDGARGHHTKVVRARGVALVQQPPFSPESNPVSRDTSSRRRAGLSRPCSEEARCQSRLGRFCCSSGANPTTDVLVLDFRNISNTLSKHTFTMSNWCYQNFTFSVKIEQTWPYDSLTWKVGLRFA